MKRGRRHCRFAIDDCRLGGMGALPISDWRLGRRGNVETPVALRGGVGVSFATMNIPRIVLAVVLCVSGPVGCAGAGARGPSTRPAGPAGNWYERSFYLLHVDHHTRGTREVGRDAAPAETDRLFALSKPDMLQIHAKGNPGWTTYPSKIGHTPPKLARDVLGLYRDIARRNGYHWSIYYNIGRDQQIMLRRPQFNRDRPDGTEHERALCYHSGVGPQYIYPMLREIMAGYKPDGFWFDGSVFTIATCYCPVCRKRFQREQNLDAPTQRGQKGWSAYHEMQRQIYREFVADTCRLIHRIDPKCLVTFNWAYSVRMPEKPDAGIAYLTGDIANRVAWLPLEAHWYDGTGLPFDLMTTGHTYAKNPSGTFRSLPKPAPQIQQEMAVVIANGGRFNLWDNPTSESALVAERHEAFARYVAPFLRARQRWCMGSRRRPDVSVLHNAASHYALAERTPRPFDRRNARIEGADDVLRRLHLNYEMVGDWRLHDQDVRSPLLIVEHPRSLSPPDVEAIAKLIASGRDVLITGMGLYEYRSLWPVFGIESVAPTKGPEPLTAKVGGRTYPLNHWLGRVTAGAARTLLTATDAKGASHLLLTAHRHGKGTAYFMPMPLLTSHGVNTPPIEFVRDVFGLLRPPSDRLVTTDAPQRIQLVLRQRGDPLVLHMVNMDEGRRTTAARPGTYTAVVIDRLDPAPRFHVSIRLGRKPAAVTLQPRNRPVDGWRYENGRVEFDVPPFDVHEMVVIDPR